MSKNVSIPCLAADILKIRDIADSWLRLTMTKLLKKPLPEKMCKKVKERFSICNECIHLKNRGGLRIKLYFCERCNCAFPGFIFSEIKSCPVKKWL